MPSTNNSYSFSATASRLVTSFNTTKNSLLISTSHSLLYYNYPISSKSSELAMTNRTGNASSSASQSAYTTRDILFSSSTMKKPVTYSSAGTSIHSSSTTKSATISISGGGNSSKATTSSIDTSSVQSLNKGTSIQQESTSYLQTVISTGSVNSNSSTKNASTLSSAGTNFHPTSTNVTAAGNGSTFPVWAIIVITVESFFCVLLLAGCIYGVVFCMRRHRRSTLYEVNQETV
ncbi:hypothetical protein XELAEV_18039236mg [Xenopus laevis]|uniref:Uncharacterized protein n=1 Tax=Xenopus laevis TaxID=8355 RepID=A0A974H7M6_XENLA|nr:hypothetical protein XELAEV_18039236mg [Xenopus laevis]